MDATQFVTGKYLQHIDLKKPANIWTIEVVTKEELNAEVRLAVKFHQHDKFFVNNKTTAKKLVEMFGTDTDYWTGKKVLVFRTKTMYQGDEVFCIRLSDPSHPPLLPIFEANGKAVGYSHQVQPQGQPGPFEGKPAPEVDPGPQDPPEDIPF